MQKTKHVARKFALVPSCAVGVFAAVLTALLLISIGAMCIFNEYFSVKNMSVVSIIVQALAVFAGCTIAGKITHAKAVLCCSVTAAIVVFVFISAALLFFDGLRSNVLGGMLATLLGLGGAIFFVVKKKTHSARRTKRRHSC